MESGYIIIKQRVQLSYYNLDDEYANQQLFLKRKLNTHNKQRHESNIFEPHKLESEDELPINFTHHFQVLEKNQQPPK